MRVPLLLLAAALGAASLSAAAPDARKLWTTNCSECHGKDGRGRTDEGRRLKIADLTNPQIQDSFTDEQAFRIIKKGLKDDAGPVMHNTSYRLTDEEVAALVLHVRTFRRK
jgi:cytochrome c553